MSSIFVFKKEFVCVYLAIVTKSFFKFEQQDMDVIGKPIGEPISKSYKSEKLWDV